MSKTLIWLASYPKSGNTWLRAFLANYLFEIEGPATFEHIQRVSSGDSSAPSYTELAGGNAQRLALPALMELRQRHLARIAGNGAPVNFVKTHAAHVAFHGKWMIPAPLTRGAIYLVRHPLDMLVSYADHWGLDLKTAAGNIANPKNFIPPSEKTVPQFIGAWSEHVKGWTRTRDFPVLVLRYEDLIDDPERAFTRVVNHIGAPLDRGLLSQAVERCSFDRLAEQEQLTGFAERGPRQERFFRQGQTGTGQSVPEDIAAKVRADHETIMRKFRYE